MRRAGATVLLAGVAVLAGCGDDGPPALPNPASAYCEEQGGRVEIVTDDDGGQRGICVLADGRRVDEWEHYRDRPPEG